MKRCGTWIVPSISALFLALAACGGDDGAQPLGLFSANVSQSTSNDLKNFSWALAGSDLGLGTLNNGQPTATSSKQIMIAPLLGWQLFVPGTAKSNSTNQEGPLCRWQDSKHVRCAGSMQGPQGGELAFTMTVNFRELTQTRGDGTAAMELLLNNYAFTEPRCGRNMRLEGVFSCSADMQVELIDPVHNPVYADVSLAAMCNTARDPDLLLAFIVDDVAHTVGYDLAINYQGQVDVRQPLPLNKTHITGTVVVDGTQYLYAEMQEALDLNQCE